MHNHSRSIFFLSFLFLFCSIPAGAVDQIASSEQLSQKTPWERLVTQRIGFQNELYEMAAKRWPEHSQLLQVHRDLQLALITRRNLVFHYWTKHHPEKLQRSSSLKQMLQFSWTPEEREEFIREIPQFEGIDAQIELLRQLNNSNPDWKTVQAKFAELETEPAYWQLIQKYERQLQEVIQEHSAT